MKLLENSKFEALNNALSFETGNYYIEGRLESYSCKMAQVDKKLLKSLTTANEGVASNSLLALSPPASAQNHSPIRQMVGGPGGGNEGGDGSYLADTIPTKTLAYLISTLNISFHPDYDFSFAKSEEFSREPSLQLVMHTVASQLQTVCADTYASLQQELWSALDQDISLNDCEIYSYLPDLSCDPFGEDGCIWSFNFFFFNKKDKKLDFFTCRATSTVHAVDSGYGSELGCLPFDYYEDKMDVTGEYMDEY